MSTEEKNNNIENFTVHFINQQIREVKKDIEYFGATGKERRPIEIKKGEVIPFPIRRKNGGGNDAA